MRFDLPEGEYVYFPSIVDCHAVHENHALASNNRRGILDEGKLEGALARPQQVLAYSDENPDLITLAAYLWHGISEAHGYEDGNKRTGLLVAISFLAANGVTYDAPEFQIGRFVLSLFERREFSIKALDEHLRNYSRWT